MKTKCLLILLTIFLTTTHISNAQFFKKLKKRVEEKVENAIVEKTTDKAAEKASKAMDDMLDVNPFVSPGAMKGNPELIADTYEFSWKYSLKITTKEGDMVFDYYLEPDSSYFGFTTSATGATGMFTVMDTGQEVMAMFIKNDKNNTGVVSSMPSGVDLKEEENGTAKFTFEQLPDKTINGYRCKGIKGISEDYEMVMYLTDEAEVSFSDIYKKGTAKIPVELEDYFSPDDKALMITMDMKSLKNNKQDMTMECVGLEKESKTIKKSDYKFM